MSLIDEIKLYKSLIDKVKLYVSASSDADDPVYIETAAGSEKKNDDLELNSLVFEANEHLEEIAFHLRVITGEKYK